MTIIPRPASALGQRLRPLHMAVFLQGVGFWVPVEKLFMNQIGFDAASIGLVAAAYAAVGPVLDVPTGILADRWSRRGCLMVASAALGVSALIGGLSHNVATYVLSALALGVFFAMSSGTVDSLIYDIVVEETGDSRLFEQQMGRNRLVHSTALVFSALLGGVLAELAGARATYFLTVPFAALSILALMRCTEPAAPHRGSDRVQLRAHIILTLRTLTRGGRLLPVVTMAVLTGLILQVVLEFGPLWLVALAVPAVLYGPYWAGVVSSLGLGGLVAGHFHLDRPRCAAGVAVLMVAASLVLTASSNFVVVAAAQVILALLVVAAGIHVTHLLHDTVPSALRTGVASGVNTLTWITFLPIALGFGFLSRGHGVQTAAWTLTVVTVIAGASLIGMALTRRVGPTRGSAAPPREQELATSSPRPGTGWN